MHVIGAGMSRTGTMSTRAALERLGFPCYHMTEVARADGHLDAWNAFLSGNSAMNWTNLFANYAATVDTPCCLYYRDMMEAFPSAKVLLNLREPVKWYESLVTLSTALEEFRPLAGKSKRLNEFLTLTDYVGSKLTNGDFSQKNCLRAFNAHNDAVQSYVPAERLLVFQVQDGWKPLCDFLEKDVPLEPFPHLNEGRETIHEFVNQSLLENTSN